jgi:hypothetical protein
VLHFKVEPEEMHENPKPLEMDEDSNDLDRMDDRDVGHDEQRDFMQEDSEGNSKDKGTNMGFSNSHIEQRGGNKIIALMKNIVGSQGGDKDMEIDYNVGDLLEDISPDNRYEEEQYEIDGETTVYDLTHMGLEEKNPDAQCDEVQQEGVVGVTPVYDPTKKKVVVQREIVVIPEASTLSRKRKRRALSADEHSLDHAERMKAVRNLDFTSQKGNSSITQTSFVQFSNSYVIENLQSIGISLGDSADQISLAVEQIKEVERKNNNGRK